jgi:23S rRNA pseudouridine2604 synthase
MPNTVRLHVFLCRHFGISNDVADKMIHEGRVRVNGKVEPRTYRLEFWEEISVDGKVIREGKKFSYVKFYKPRGIECTLNPDIENNLLTAFHFPERLFPVGRLDKESEGLLLLTDDGRIFNHVALDTQDKEKEYHVSLDKTVDDHFLQRMGEGVEIMGKLTRPAKIWRDDKNECAFHIILTQGLNRQIRRMCYKLGYEVTRLVRVRIVNITLGDLQAGEWRTLSEDEMKGLK